MLRRLDLRGSARPAADLPRPEVAGAGPVAAVAAILDDVRARGDVALVELTERFDGVRLSDVRVPSEAIAAARDAAAPELVAALEVARDAIDAFHRSQLRPPHTFERGGVTIACTDSPVERAGVYVPGGRGAYPSTVLMTAVPARVAGVGQIVLCVPPDRATGAVAPAVLAAAAVAGVDEVYAVGGAQAIGAMAYGTPSIAPVDVIVGPGNVYVALAKRAVAGVVGVPSAFAGPSEVVVVADGTARPDFAAIDVVVQAEHGPDGLAWLVTWDPAVADAVCDEIAAYVATSPRRDEITSTFAEGGYAVVVDGPDAALAVVDAIAPEHLQLMCDGAEALASRVRNAGAVFCGNWSPASVGDYAAGPSHVLPTDGTARFSSALTVADFVRQHHVVTLTPEAMADVGPTVELLAEVEGFAAHAASVRRRLDVLDGRDPAGSAP